MTVYHACLLALLRCPKFFAPYVAKFRPLRHFRLASSAAGSAAAKMPKAGALPTALHPEVLKNTKMLKNSQSYLSTA